MAVLGTVVIKTTKDARTIRTGKHYTEFRILLFYHQHSLCKRCGRWTSLEADILSDSSFHVHHVNGRGLGGGKRDDTIKSCEGLCGACHRSEHNQ
jgi:hypothetical protein